MRIFVYIVNNNAKIVIKRIKIHGKVIQQLLTLAFLFFVLTYSNLCIVILRDFLLHQIQQTIYKANY